MHDVTHWFVGLFFCYVECISIFFLVYSCLALQLIDWKSTVNFVANILSWTKKQPLPCIEIISSTISGKPLRYYEGTVLLWVESSKPISSFLLLMKQPDIARCGMLFLECWTVLWLRSQAPLSLTLKEVGDTSAILIFSCCKIQFPSSWGFCPLFPRKRVSRSQLS